MLERARGDIGVISGTPGVGCIAGGRKAMTVLLPSFAAQLVLLTVTQPPRIPLVFAVVVVMLPVVGSVKLTVPPALRAILPRAKTPLPVMVDAEMAEPPAVTVVPPLKLRPV